MLHSWHIGDIRVTSIVEYFGPTHDPEAFYPDFDRDGFNAILSGLPPGHYYPVADRLVVAVQIWLVEAGDRRILIDTGCGNNKPRRTPRMDHLNSLWPAWLAATGVGFDSITDVVLTHMHADHVGWNTQLDGDKWVPSFPNATYHFPKSDFDWFEQAHKNGQIGDGGSFTDSVVPIVEAGLVNFIVDQKEIADCLRVVPAPGHSPGQLNYWIESNGERGVFSGDIFHTVVQVLNPGWNSAFCIQPEQALITRKAFLEKAADAQALVMPCHFAPPHCGYIRRQGDGFAFEPATSGYGSV